MQKLQSKKLFRKDIESFTNVIKRIEDFKSLETILKKGSNKSISFKQVDAYIDACKEYEKSHKRPRFTILGRRRLALIKGLHECLSQILENSTQEYNDHKNIKYKELKSKN